MTDMQWVKISDKKGFIVNFLHYKTNMASEKNQVYARTQVEYNFSTGFDGRFVAYLLNNA